MRTWVAVRILYSFVFITASATSSEYSVTVGGANEQRVAAIVSDAAGNTYVTGSRISDSSTSADLFVTKLDPSGGILFTATFGGNSSGQAKAIALDPSGNIYVAGSTFSRNFPLLNALQTQPGSRFLSATTGFLVKLSPDGDSVLSSTYFGGALGGSSVNSIAVDAKGDVYLTGFTFSTDFPQTDGLPAGQLKWDGLEPTSGAFVAKITATGDTIVYAGVIVGHTLACGGGSSCFLSERDTAGIAIAVDLDGNAYIAANTNTTDIPTTPGALLRTGIGAFVAKVNSAGSGLVYLTYLGDANRAFGGAGGQISGSIAHAITVDSTGVAFVAGSTWDARFPATPGAVQPSFSGSQGDPSPPDAFVAKLQPNGAAMVWATYLGGAAADSAQSIALDTSGNIWVSGTTASPDFPNFNGWCQGTDFLIELDPSGSALLYSARFPPNTISQSIAVDSEGLVHAVGASGLVSAIAPRQLQLSNPEPCFRN